MFNFFTESQINKLTELGIAAGEIAKNYFLKKDFIIERKADGSQVTSADIAVSKFLRENLEHEFPEIPIVCEEGKLREIVGEVFFLIDPIDGTSSFVKGSVEFCVNIAVIKNKKAIFGLIYAPLFEGGKMIFSNQKNQVMRRLVDLQSQAELVEAKKNNQSLSIVTSARSKISDVKEYVARNLPEFSENFTLERLSSAVKFFRILEGEANLYLHFRPSMEWDTAAGQALAEMNEIEVIKLDEPEILTYHKPGFENCAFLLRNF